MTRYQAAGGALECANSRPVAASRPMAHDDEAIVELIGALATSLTRALALATPEQLKQLDAEILELLGSVEGDSASASAFRSVLREIAERLAALSPQ
jgi:hypothetical protein